jgi:hypothetical protein
VASGYDVVKWIEPWRGHWQSVESGTASRDPRLATWLPTMERHLGPSTASEEAGAAPSTNYIEGFTTGVRETWHAAVKDHLLPPTPQAFEAWLRAPAQPRHTPPALLTIADLRASAKRVRRNKSWIMSLRIALWIFTSLFALSEVAAIAFSVTGSWNPNNTSSQIIGNLMCSVPLAVLVTTLVFDARRANRRTRPPGSEIK